MTHLPPGWIETTLGKIADTTLGKMLDRGKETGQHAVPYLRNINVQWGRIDLSDVLTMDIDPSQQEFFRLRSGDLLVCEGGEVGRCAIWQDDSGYMAFQKALHRVRPHARLDTSFLRYFLEHMSLAKELEQYVTGSTIKHLPQQQLRKLPIRLPPMAEQRRIVATLEECLARIEAAEEGLASSFKRAENLAKRVIIEAVPTPVPDHWKVVKVADAGRVDLGRARHPDWHNGLHMRPYLRVANVYEDAIDASDLMEMDFPPDVFNRFRLAKGDVLLNEGQSPNFLGRPAMYRGVPENVAFTNSLLRFRAGPEVNPEWALLVFRRHMHTGRFIRELRITTNIAHLSATRLKGIEFPVPPLGEQERIVIAVRDKLSLIDRFRGELYSGRQRARQLRRALLREAFAGRLVGSGIAERFREPVKEPVWVGEGLF